MGILLCGCHAVDVQAQRHPQFRTRRQVVAARHHADDRVDAVVQSQSGSEHGVAAAESPLPQAVRDHRHRTPARSVVLGGDGAAESRHRAIRRKVAGADRGTVHALRLIVSGDGAAALESYSARREHGTAPVRSVFEQGCIKRIEILAE